MGDSQKQEETTKFWQPAALIAGFALVIWWFLAPSPVMTVDNSPDVIASSETLLIPRLSIQVPVLYAPSSREDDIQVLLRSGTVHLQGTALPGQIGNCYIVGHSSDFKNALGDYKTVFSRLPELKIGDEVRILSREETFIYRVINTSVIEPDDLSVLSQDTRGRKLLTLQTSYPIGSAKQRFLVVAEQKEK